jgi:hypothetical protein
VTRIASGVPRLAPPKEVVNGGRLVGLVTPAPCELSGRPFPYHCPPGGGPEEFDAFLFRVSGQEGHTFTESGRR